MKVEKITKRYSRKITHDWCSWEFSTELTAAVELTEKDAIIDAGNKLFSMAKALTVKDMESMKNEIKPTLTEVKHE
jgi:hypothetical protein